MNPAGNFEAHLWAADIQQKHAEENLAKIAEAQRMLNPTGVLIARGAYLCEAIRAARIVRANLDRAALLLQRPGKRGAK